MQRLSPHLGREVCACVCVSAQRGSLALRCSVQLVVSTEAPCQSTGRVSIMRMNIYIPHPVRTSANRADESLRHMQMHLCSSAPVVRGGKICALRALNVSYMSDDKSRVS